VNQRPFCNQPEHQEGKRHQLEDTECPRVDGPKGEGWKDDKETEAVPDDRGKAFIQKGASGTESAMPGKARCVPNIPFPVAVGVSVEIWR
jgi:hypothetical protein